MKKQPGDDFDLLLEAVQAGAPVPEDSRYAGELRVAAALAALVRPPSAAFEQALASRLAAQTVPWGVYTQGGTGFGVPRMVYAGLVVATIATSVALAATPAGPALADAVERLVHVFVQDAPPDVPGAPEIGRGVRPQPSASFALAAAEVSEDIGYPAYLPVGWVELGVESASLPSAGNSVSVVFGPVGNALQTTHLVASTPPGGMDLALQGQEVEVGSFRGVVDTTGDPLGTKVLSWTDGLVLYQLFSTLPLEEMVRIAESVQ